MSLDLRTRYLGLSLRSPIVASAAPQNGEVATARALEAAGVGAIVLPSLFEEEILAEEIELNRALEQGTEHFAEALDYFPAVDTFVGRCRSLPGRSRTRQGQRSRARSSQASTRAPPAAGSARHGGSSRRAPTRSS